ncbi:MAG: hypothetical protein P8J37_07105 [Fuerstiella sp.]|nr:hypothetical protein [Fuerstiella sp.]
MRLRRSHDRHLRSHDQTLVSTLASEDITIEEFRTRVVGEATHFLMSASDKYEGPSHTSGRKTYRFPEGAWAMIRGFGGDQRVLGLIPKWLDQVDWKGRLEQSFGNCVATRRVPHETISVVCEMSNVPVDTVMDRLTCNNPHVTDISGRIHTRTDVDW